jgi:hypothetical protein
MTRDEERELFGLEEPRKLGDESLPERRFDFPATRKSWTQLKRNCLMGEVGDEPESMVFRSEVDAKKGVG